MMRYLLLCVDNLVYLDHWEIMESILFRSRRVISRRRSKSSSWSGQLVMKIQLDFEKSETIAN